MVTYTVIATDDDQYRISALVYDGKFEMPSFECYEDGKLKWAWDNDTYLIETLLPTLRGEIGFKDVVNDIPLDDFKYVLPLFEEAIKMKFFKINNDGQIISDTSGQGIE